MGLRWARLKMNQSFIRGEHTHGPLLKHTRTNAGHSIRQKNWHRFETAHKCTKPAPFLRNTPPEIALWRNTILLITCANTVALSVLEFGWQVFGNLKAAANFFVLRFFPSHVFPPI